MSKIYTFPKSMRDLGLVPASELQKVRRLMIGTDGWTNTGKTEFALSAPGPKVIIPIDCSYDSILDNPYPPKSRRLDDATFDDIKIPMNHTLKQEQYKEYFVAFRKRLYVLLEVPEIRTIIIDGDSDSYELQLLAEYGRTSQIHPMQYPLSDGPRRAMVKRCWESKKIIIATSKLKDKYENSIDEATGKPLLDDKGKNVQHRVPGEYKRQGFRDQDYLWQIQIRHLYKPPEPIDLSAMKPLDRLRAAREGKNKTEPQWGLRIMKCKSNTRLEGDELWGDDCNFKSLVQYIYPQVPLTEWGFDRNG